VARHRFNYLEKDFSFRLPMRISFLNSCIGRRGHDRSFYEVVDTNG